MSEWWEPKLVYEGVPEGSLDIIKVEIGPDGVEMSQWYRNEGELEPYTDLGMYIPIDTFWSIVRALEEKGYRK